MRTHWFIPILAELLFGFPIAWTAEPVPQMYEVITETGMPHLEENLRYATRVERRCMDEKELMTSFWMLAHVSLQDCELVEVSQDAEVALFELKCSGGHGTTGSARWQFGPRAASGTLQVRLGGKNMTFYQRITAKPLGACAVGAPLGFAHAERAFSVLRSSFFAKCAWKLGAACES